MVEDCERVVREGWSREVMGNKLDQVVRKLRVCRSMLKKQSKESIPNNRKIIDKLV